MTREYDDVIGRVAFNDDGLVPVIVQQESSKRVLMLAWMDAEAMRRSLASGRVTYWSRSRQEYWRKGDTSGNVQHLRSMALDCDADAVLIQVDQRGPACHTGTATCFEGRNVGFDPAAVKE